MPKSRLAPAIVQAALAACCCAWLLATAAASAQTDPDELARRHFESGAAYFEQGEYDSALREFGRAYDLSRRVELLLNLASVHERLGQLDLAVRRLDEYLAEQEEATVRIRRDNLKRRLDEELSALPMPGLQPEDPAEPTAPAASATPATPLASDATKTLPPPAPDSFEFAPRPNRTPSFVLFAVGGAAATASLVTGLLAVSEFDKAERRCGRDCNDEEVAKVSRLEAISTVLTGAAVALGGVGLYLYFNPSYESPNPAGLRFGLRTRAQGAEAQAGWTF